MLEYKGVKITWLGHDSFKISNSATIIVDPFKLRSDPGPADVLLITHEHFDHCSPEDMKKVVTTKTVVVAPASCKAEVSKVKPGEVKLVKPGDKVSLAGLRIEAVPAYNLNKYREPGKVFHPKEEGKVGYVIETSGVRIYHAGDTDAIPEMKSVKADLALLPVSGTYVMTAEEAADAAGRIRPFLAIPMHYGTIVGSERDAARFKELAPCEVRILKPE